MALTSDQIVSATVHATPFEEKPFYTLAKRVMETAIALLILGLLAPVWLGLALLIKLTSPGPVLYRGRVVGKGGREFTYYKFRSMRHDSDNQQHQHFIHSYVNHYHRKKAEDATETTAEAPGFKLTNDSRVTGIGRFIRKCSLDEVPQLLNVIRGDMAIVGPRPPVPYEYTLYDDWCQGRLRVLPGITGLAQVRGRGQVSFQQMVEIDLEYIAGRSLKFDLEIMLKTPLAMLKGA